jgi:RHS repeat-associated protein
VAQKLQQNPINSFSYTYDGMGNQTSMTDLSGMHNYTYDSIYQLTQATHPNMPTEQFGYDSVGNRISAEGETVGTLVATNYTYDLENRLNKVEYPGMVAQYKYDPFGRRIEKNVNGDITRYVYDGSNIVTEYDANGNVKNAYIHNLAIDDPFAVQQGTHTYFYQKNGLGSVVNLTDGTGSVVNSYIYKSFGEIYSQTSSVVQPLTFTAREYDPESGLYYYRARYYDPKAGRFPTKDPIGLVGRDVNLYRAMGNNPINLVDPLGFFLQFRRSERILQWVDFESGWIDPAFKWPAVSGPYKKGALPLGIYHLTGEETPVEEEEDRMTDRCGNTYKFRLHPQFDAKRGGLLIHPLVEDSDGTLGCIGLVGCTSSFRNFVNQMISPPKEGRAGQWIPLIVVK